MSVSKTIQWLRSLFKGSGAASDKAATETTATDKQELEAFSQSVGGLPEGVLELYRAHNGSAQLPTEGSYSLPVRLMPVQEARDTTESLGEIDELTSPVGRIAWLWTDDNSNYVGAFTTGRLAGLLVKLIHDEPSLAPSYRSVTSFLTHLPSYSPTEAPTKEVVRDLYSLPQDLPATEDDPRYVESDRQLARHFAELALAESDVDTRRQFAECSICLTPVADTAEVVRFFVEDDMWTPALAVRLIELRGYGECVAELEQLAREGRPNGDSTAMRCLTRLNTQPAAEALGRLQAELSGQKLKLLQHWTRMKDRLTPPRWP